MTRLWNPIKPPYSGSNWVQAPDHSQPKPDKLYNFLCYFYCCYSWRWIAITPRRKQGSRFSADVQMLLFWLLDVQGRSIGLPSAHEI